MDNKTTSHTPTGGQAMSNEFTPDQKYLKSYKTEATMLKAIEKSGLGEFRFIRYTFQDGRITPVFTLKKDEQYRATEVQLRGFSVII